MTDRLRDDADAPASQWSCFLHGAYEASECPHCIHDLREKLRAAEKELHEWRLGDSYGELIEANQKAIADVDARALQLIRAEFRREGLRTQRIEDILEAAASFHPMHGEDWSGFPTDDVPGVVAKPRWRIDFTCCGREDGVAYVVDYREAERIRESYTSGVGVHPQGYSAPDHEPGHRRSAVISRGEDWSGFPADEVPVSRDTGEGEAT